MHQSESLSFSPSSVRPDCRFGSKADMCGALPHVRFAPESDTKCDIWECPLWANSGHVRRKEHVRFGPRSGDQSDRNHVGSSASSWICLSAPQYTMLETPSLRTYANGEPASVSVPAARDKSVCTQRSSTKASSCMRS